MGQTVRRGSEAGRLAMLNREDRFCSIGGKLKFGPFELSSRERMLRHEGLGRRSLDGRAPLLKRRACGSTWRPFATRLASVNLATDLMALRGVRESKTSFVSNVATTETLEELYRAYDGNDALDDLGRKSPQRTQFPLTRDPSEPTSPGRVRLAFA